MIAFLRDLFTKDLGLKLFSLVMAILIYSTITLVAFKNESPVLPPLTLATDVRTFYNLPVRVISSAADVRRFRVDPATVAVRVQGAPQVLANLESKDIRVLVDLTGIETAHDLRQRLEVSTPPGVTHVGVVPPDVRVIFPAGK